MTFKFLLNYYFILVHPYIYFNIQAKITHFVVCLFGSQYLKLIFPKTSNSKVKENIFLGLQVCQLLDKENFETTMDEHELVVKHSFKNVSVGFLENTKSSAREYSGESNQMLPNLECNMSLKVHFLHSHLLFSQRM